MCSPRAANGQRRLIDAIERYLGSDPGGERFRSGLQAIVAWLAAISASALVQSSTHAFEITASVPGGAAASHTALLIVLMIGSTVALNAGFVVTETTPQARAITSLTAGLGLWAGMALAVVVHGDRLAALTLLVAVPSLGAWFRRYGPRGFAPSFTLHVGYLIGFLVAAQVSVAHLGWVGVIIAVAAASTYLVGLVFLPGHARAPQRMRRSYLSRARRVLALTAAVMDSAASPPARRRLAKRLRRQVVRLNETALVLDVQLAASPAGPQVTETNEQLRRSLFDHERAVATLARVAQLDARQPVHPAVRDYGRALVAAANDLDAVASLDLAGGPAGHALTDLHRQPAGRGDGDLERDKEIVERYGQAGRALAFALNPDLAEPDRPHVRVPVAEDLHRNVPLVGGWLPGAAIVNSLASSRKGAGWRDRISLSVSTRVAVQLAAGLTLAITFADLISPSHVLWAVVAVYVTFLGSTSNLEQVRKAAFRVAGTLIGVVVGGGLAHLTYPHTVPTLIVIAAAVFFMSYFAKVNYALVVFAATLGVTQFYAQVGVLSNTVLLARVEVTAVGAACAILVGLVVLPLRTVNAATLAVAGYLRALAHVLDGVTGLDLAATLSGPTANTRLLDARFHAATASLRPLTRTLFGKAHPRCAPVMQLVDVSHELGRAVVHDIAGVAQAGEDMTQIGAISQHAAALARIVADDLEQPAGGRTVVSVAAETKAPKPSTASLRAEIEGIDTAVTQLARTRGLSVPSLAGLSSAAHATRPTSA